MSVRSGTTQVLGLHKNMPHTTKALGEHHAKRTAMMMGGMGGMHPMNHMMMFGH